MSEFKIDTNFQTPMVVCNKMAEMAGNVSVPLSTGFRGIRILEPTPGIGNLVKALEEVFSVVYRPTGSFWEKCYPYKYFDIVVMNPPFNPVIEMERFVNAAMELSDNIIALLPYNYLVNSERRVSELMDYGLVSITHLPRKTFPGCRVQVAIFELKKGYAGKTEWKRFQW